MTVKTWAKVNIECNKNKVMKMMSMMTSKNIAVKVSRMKAEMKLRTMKRLVKIIPRINFEYNRTSDDY